MLGQSRNALGLERKIDRTGQTPRHSQDCIIVKTRRISEDGTLAAGNITQ
jgi:hypothetical protein